MSEVTCIPFDELSVDEATALAKDIVNSSRSEAEIRRRLTEAGFDGNNAVIISAYSGSKFAAVAMVYGPQGAHIRV